MRRPARRGRLRKNEFEFIGYNGLVGIACTFSFRLPLLLLSQLFLTMESLMVLFLALSLFLSLFADLIFGCFPQRDISL